MYQLSNTEPSQLNDLAICQMACFPKSFNTQLGKNYIAKSLKWFLQKDTRFLFHVMFNNEVVGFCGGFAPQFYGDGSSSGMLQFAFKEAVMGIAKKPWLLVNKELRNYYPFIGRNIKKKVGLKKTIAAEIQPTNYIFKESVGLVVIGVHPKYRGKGIFEILMKEFEQKALQLNIKNCNLSVRAENARAIAAYTKMGWQIQSQKDNAIIMFKHL